MFAALVSIPLILFIYLFHPARFVTRPLDGLNRGLGRIAEGGGDLRLQLPVRGRDEIGAARAFNDMMGAWRAGAPGRRLGERGDRGGEPAGRRRRGGRREPRSARTRARWAAGAVDEMVGSILRDRRARRGSRSHDSLERSREASAAWTSGRRGRRGRGRGAQMADAVVAFVDSQAISRMTSGCARSPADHLLALNAAIEAARSATGPRLRGGGRRGAQAGGEIRARRARSTRSPARWPGVRARCARARRRPRSPRLQPADGRRGDAGADRANSLVVEGGRRPRPHRRRRRCRRSATSRSRTHPARSPAWRL